MSAYEEVICGPLEAILWLAVLQTPGPLFGCIACRTSTIYVHPTHGGIHPRCIPRAMVMLAADDGDGEAIVPAEGRSRRLGAYGRRRV